MTRTYKTWINPQTLFVLACVLASAIFIMALWSIHNEADSKVTEASVSSFTLGDTKDIRYGIEVQQANIDGSYYFDGWCVVEGVTYDYYNYGSDTYGNNVYSYVNLALVEGDTVYILPTKLYEREDVSSYLNDGIVYSYAGFHALNPSDAPVSGITTEKAFVTRTPSGDKTLYLVGNSEGEMINID